MIDFTQPSPPVTGGTAVSTASDAAVQAIAGASIAGKIFLGGVIANPTGSPAGQFSSDAFNTDVRNFPAGPSLTFIPAGAGPANVANVTVWQW